MPSSTAAALSFHHALLAYLCLLSDSATAPSPLRFTIRHQSLHLQPNDATSRAAYANLKQEGRSTSLRNIPGQVLVDVALGSPAQLFTMVLDTGSSTLVVPDAFCPSRVCPSMSRYQRLHSESSVQLHCHQRCRCVQNACNVHLSYGDGSGGFGSVVADTMSVAGLHVPNVSFASFYMQHRSTRAQLFQGPVAGLLGMAYWSLNCMDGVPGGYCAPTALDRLLQHAGLEDVFAVWVGEDGGCGQLDVGAPDPTVFHSQSLVWAELGPRRFYVLTLLSLSASCRTPSTSRHLVNDSPNSFGEAIVDTGTTLLLLKSPAYDRLRDYFYAAFCSLDRRLPFVCPGDRDTVWDQQFLRFWTLNATAVGRFPTLYFYFRAAESSRGPRGPGAVVGVALAPETYWSCFPALHTQRCYFGIHRSPSPVTILGDIFLRAHYVIFDRARGRLGFAALRPRSAPPPPPPPAPGRPRSPAPARAVRWAACSGLGAFLVLSTISFLIPLLFQPRRARTAFQAKDAPWETAPLLGPPSSGPVDSPPGLLRHPQ